MDDEEMMQAIRGRQDMESRIFKEVGHWLAWMLCHIYNQNPYLKKGTKVKISDLINLNDQPEKSKETEAEALARAKAVWAKWDAKKRPF